MDQIIANFRSEFNKKYGSKAADGTYDTRDVQRLMTSNKYAEAFVRAKKGAIQAAVDMCHKAFVWRKEMDVNNLTESYFPDFILNNGAMFFRNEDRDENPIVYFRISLHKKNAQALPIMQKYMIYLLDREDKRVEGRQVVILFDMTASGVSNLDMDLIRFLITCFEEYMPDYLAYLLVYDMPWILSAAWKIIRGWLSEEARQKIIFVNGEEILKHIDKDNLFVHMGGTDDYKFVYEPPETNHRDSHLPVRRRETPTKLSADGVTPRKQVSFTRADPTVFDSMIEHDELESPAKESYDQRTTTSFTSKLKLSTNGDDTSHISSLITIRPGSEISFSPRTGQKDAVGYMVLTNPTTDKRTAYKVKTTSPHKYKVRPSSGVIRPGHAVEVTVFLSQPLEGINKDKFLVMAIEVLEDGFLSSGELADLWKSVSLANVIEHKLRCALSSKPIDFIQKDDVGEALSENSLDQLQKRINSLDSKLDILLASNRELQRHARYVTRLHKVMAFVIVCCAVLIGFTMYYRVADVQHDAQNQSSHYSCVNTSQ